MFQLFNQIKQKLSPCCLTNLFYERAFTLIELVVVIGVIGVSLPVIFGLFFLTLQQQSKIYILQEVKKNGDYALNTIRSTIKQYGEKVTDSGYQNEICPVLPTPTPTPASTLYLVDKFGNRFKYFQTSTTPSRIASESSTLGINNWYLTNDKVNVDSLGFTCYRTNPFSPPVVAVSFSVSQAQTSAPHEEKASMTYTTKIKLKSY